MAGSPDIATDGTEIPAVDSRTPPEWRTLYIEYYNECTDLRAELKEIGTMNDDIQAELEMDLARAEKEKGEVRRKLERVEVEKEDWKMKYMKLQATYNTTTSSLQRELDNVRKATTEYKTQVRELEMGNDDLERNERVVKSSLVELEEKYNRAIEEKTYLEHELLSKGAQEEEIQRLRDELRDTSLEVAILRDKESDLRHQLETRSSLGPSPMTSPSLPAGDDDLQLEDLTVQKPPLHPHISRPSSAGDTTDSLDRPPTPPPKPTLPKSVSARLGAPASPSRIPAPRRSAIPPAPAPAAPRNRTVQRMADLGTRVRLLETRISSKGAASRVVSNTFARMKEAASASTTASRREREPAAADGSPGGWVLVSDGGSSGVDSSSFAIVHPTPGPAARPQSSTSRSSASESFGRPSFDRRRSVDVSTPPPPPPTSFSTRLAERERTLSQSQSVAPLRRPSSRLGASTATVRASESRRFPARPMTPTFLPMPIPVSTQSQAQEGRRDGFAKPVRSASVRTMSTASRPTSLPPSTSSVHTPPVPPLPKGISSTAFPSSASSASSRIGRPSSVGVVRRQVTGVHTPPAGGGRASMDGEREEEEEERELTRLLASRARVRARVGSAVGGR